MDETNLIKGVREESVPRHIREEDWKNHGMRWWKRIWRSEAYASMMLKTETSGYNTAEEWLTPVNW